MRAGLDPLLGRPRGHRLDDRHRRVGGAAVAPRFRRTDDAEEIPERVVPGADARPQFGELPPGKRHAARDERPLRRRQACRAGQSGGERRKLPFRFNH